MKLKSTLKLIIPLSILAFLLSNIFLNWNVIRSHLIFVNFFFLILTFLLLVLGQIGGAFLWFKILNNLGCKVPFLESFRVFIVSNFGRFIPGVILHLVARVFLASSIGINKRVGVLSVTLESYYTLCGAFLVAVFGLPEILKILNLHLSNIIFLVYFLLLIPPTKIFTLTDKIPFLRLKFSHNEYTFSNRDHLFLLFWSGFLFLLNGVSLFLIIRAFMELQLSFILPLSGLFSAAWIVGFLTPVAPGGLGITDLSASFLLSKFFGFSLATIFILILRFGFILSEGLLFLSLVKFFGLDIINKKEKRG